jgi:hypothetical protein
VKASMLLFFFVEKIHFLGAAIYVEDSFGEEVQ